MARYETNGCLRVVVLEPDPMTGKILRFVLNDAGHEVVQTLSPAEATRTVLGAGADAVVMNTDFEGGNGYELCKELRGRGFIGPLLFISERHSSSDKLRAFDCGADDFVVKPFDPLEVVARVVSAARRFRQADHQSLGRILKVGDAELAIGELTFQAEGYRPVSLTPTEMRLLECLMRNSPMTISRDTLLDRAWPNDFIGDTNRVDVYIGRLRRKVERDAAQPEYIHTVRGIGYTFRPPVRGRVLELPVAIEEPVAASRLPG